MKALFILLVFLSLLASAEWLQYCDETQGHVIIADTYTYGQRMTPSTSQGTVESIKAYLYDSNGNNSTFDISLWYYEGGTPTTMFYSQQFTQSIDDGTAKWYEFPINQVWSNHGTEFLVALHFIQQGTLYYYGDAAASSPDRNWQRHLQGSWESTTGWGDFMFKVQFQPCAPGVEPASLGQVRTMWQ